MNFHQSFKTCSKHSHPRHLKTTSNFLTIHLKGKLTFGNGSPLEGAMYINLWWNFRGHPKFFFFFNFLKIWMVSDKTIHRAFGIHKTLVFIKQNPLEKIFIFTIYQNYTLALNYVLFSLNVFCSPSGTCFSDMFSSLICRYLLGLISLIKINAYDESLTCCKRLNSLQLSKTVANLWWVWVSISWSSYNTKFVVKPSQTYIHVLYVYPSNPPDDKGRNQMQNSQNKTCKGLVIVKTHLASIKHTPNVIMPIIITW